MSHGHGHGHGHGNGPGSKGSQTIAFTAPTTPVTYEAGTTLALTATSDAGLSVSFASNDSSVVSVSGAVATVQAPGTAVITASQAGDEEWLAAADVAHSITVIKADQTLSAMGLETKYVGDAAFSILATSSAALTSFSLTTSDASVASVSGMTVTPLAPGIATITVVQAGNSFYNAAEWKGLLTVKAVEDADGDGVNDAQDDIDTDLTDAEITQGGDVSIDASDTSGQKHLRLEVPHYNSETSTATAPSSYIHMGSRRTDDSGKAPGDDLLEMIGLTTSTQDFYLDDYRYKNSQQHPSTVYHRKDGVDDQTKTPQALTQQLITRGGWREHTDGNRITTTRGDRVEVIGGNYKMVVLGRVWARTSDNGWGQSYWESSGGHNKDGTNTPGEVTSIVWKASESQENGSYESTWKAYEETIKGKVISRYTGNQYEWNECDLVVDVTGSPDSVGKADSACPDIPSADVASAQQQTNPEDGWVMSASPARKKINPNITDSTTATSIKDEIHANQSISAKIEEDEVIRTSKVETTTVTGSITQKTFAMLINDQKGQTKTKDQPGDGSVSYKPIKLFKENLTAEGALILGEFGGLKLSLAVGGMHWTNTGMGASLTIGAVASLTVGLDTSFFLASSTVAANLTMANTLEMTASLGAQIGIEAVYKTKKDGIGMTDKQMSLLYLMQAADKSTVKAIKKAPKVFTCFL